MIHSRPGTGTRSITVRMSLRQRDLIDRAAALGKTRSAYFLDASARQAEAVLLDWTVFRLDPDAWDRFEAMLDQPPAPTDALRRMLDRRPPWE